MGEEKVVVGEVWGRERPVRPAAPNDGRRREGSIRRSPGRQRTTGRGVRGGLEVGPPPSDRAARLGRRSRRVRVMPRRRSIQRGRVTSWKAWGSVPSKAARASSRVAGSVLERTE